MFRRTLILSLIVVIGSVCYGKDRTQAELRFIPATSAESNAGVWVDGHYVGFVGELKGSRTVRLLPGKHEVVVRNPWYQDHVEQIVLEPGQNRVIRLSMVKLSAPAADASFAELKIIIVPDRAAVFMDGQFVGHANEFDHWGQGLRAAPGEHKVTVALPGYLPFQTALSLHPGQKLRIATTLSKGSGSRAGAFVSPE